MVSGFDHQIHHSQKVNGRGDEEMTREEILAMPAGRELDSLISEKIMGYVTHGHFREKNGVRILVQPYSTDISAAWEVVEKIQGLRELNGCKVRLQVKILVIRGIYTVSIIDYLNNDKCLGEETANTAPEAICKAALIAVMEVSR
jgi:hypothetical protein